MKYSKGIKIAVKQVTTRDDHKIEEIDQRQNIYIYNIYKYISFVYFYMYCTLRSVNTLKLNYARVKNTNKTKKKKENKVYILNSKYMYIYKNVFAEK